MEGIGELLAGERSAALDSLFDPGPPKPGAEVLMNSMSDKKLIAVIAVHSFGKGRVLAISSNTFWRWARQSENLRKAYGLFWRQAARSLAGGDDSGRVIEIRWDRKQYRPGEQATVFLRTIGTRSGNELRIAASLSDGEETVKLTPEASAEQEGLFTIGMFFRKRADYVLRVSAYDDTGLMETMEQTVSVEPLTAEGSNLELNEDFLERLARLGSGFYAHENEALDEVVNFIMLDCSKTALEERSLVSSGPWFLAAVLLLLVVEWVLRRHMNMI
jgi:hypothetical protein